MDYKFQIGDEFKIKGIKGRSKSLKCKYPDKTFTIAKVSNHGTIYYIDTRTNKKCKCVHCRRPNQSEYDYKTGEMVQTNLKQLSPFEIILVRSNLQRLREIKLKLLYI